MKLNRQYNMDCRVGLKQMITDKQQVDTVITSPPYYKVRDYGIPPSVWGGDINCNHNFSIETINIESTKNKDFNKRYSGSSGQRKQEKSQQLSIERGFCSKCGCYDDKTEILTNNGWKLFKNLRKFDKVASLENGFLKFVEPQTYYEYEWNNKLIHFYGQNIDLCVTPEHNMYVQKRSYKNKKEFFYDFNFIQARFTKIGYKIKRNLKWKGKKTQYFEIPKIQTRFNNHKKIGKIKIENWLEFLGLWIADGYTHKSKRLGRNIEYYTAITQTKKREEVEAILNKLPFNYNYTGNKDYIIYNKQLSLYLIKLGKTKSKYIPKEVKDLSPILLTHFLKGYLIGDGHIREDGRIEACTISKELADDLQEIGLKTGYVSSISEKIDRRQNRSKLYRIPFIKNQKITRITHKEKIDYKGKVYCVEVPSHILLIRRNGKSCWCGNSWKGTLGNEPSINLYISHLCDIFDLVKKVLNNYGSLWVNLGDTMSTQGGQNRATNKDYSDYSSIKLKNRMIGVPLVKSTNLPPKCECGIPSRFKIEMIDNHGWILRRTIIWEKGNSMPSSVKNNFTPSYEYILWFVKNVKPLYWTNKRTLQLVSKKPLGIKGIENFDWEWKICSKCRGVGLIEGDKQCPSCKGLGKRKKTLWSSHDYYFEQQFEKATTEFIYSRNSKKGNIQEANNPRKSWGYTQKELKQYNSKYLKDKKLKGSSLVNSTKRDRDLSRVQAKELFPNNIKKQKEYIRYIHDHGFTKHEIATNRIGNYSYSDSLHKNIYSIIGQRNKRNVWHINTKPSKSIHFALFPDTLVKTPILATSPKFICSECGMPRVKIIEAKGGTIGTSWHDHKNDLSMGMSQKHSFNMENYSREFIGYTNCNCGKKFIPGVVLDPFAGIGTALKVAYSLGRNYIGFDISKEYCDIFDKWYKNQSIRLDKWIEDSPK